MKNASKKSGMPYTPDQDWQAEDDHRTLSRASDIQRDKGRMGGVKKYHRKAQKSLNRVGQSFGGSR